MSRSRSYPKKSPPIPLACGALNHPNIVAVYDTGQEGDVAYIVSELVEGESGRAFVEVERSVVSASPDGARILLGDFRGKWSLARLDGEGSPDTIPLARSENFYGWTADSRGLYVGKQVGPELTVERYDIENGRRAPWKALNSGRRDVTLSNLCMTPDGSAWAYSRNRSIDRLILARGLES
jgi:serine/threonine protein kinase